MMKRALSVFIPCVLLVGCSVDPSEGGSDDKAANGPNVGPNGATPSTSADCPETTPGSSPSPSKVDGLVEQCAGAYLCKYGPTFESGDEVHLFADGGRCIGRYAGSDDMVLGADGSLIHGQSQGTWHGNAVAWDYELTDHNGSTWKKSCVLIAGK